MLLMTRVQIVLRSDARWVTMRSRAVPQRLLFRQEGLFRDAEWLYDHFVDHVVYAMLVLDWTGSVVNGRQLPSGGTGKEAV